MIWFQNQSNKPPIPASSSSSLGSSFLACFSSLTGALVVVLASGADSAGCELASKLNSGIVNLKLNKIYPDSSDKATMFLKACPIINGTVASIG